MRKQLAEEAIGWGRGSQEGFTEEVSCVGRPFQEKGPDSHQNLLIRTAGKQGVEVFLA